MKHKQCIEEHKECMTMEFTHGDNIPTRPNRTQYNAANIGKGIDANTAPNFPANNKR
jgi:hypothetical protein